MSDKMAEIIKKASELAKHAPENLQDAAFQKAFDALMAEDDGGGGKPSGGSTREKTAKKKTARSNKPETADDVPTLDDLNRTEHPEINHNGTGLENSLRLIRAAREDLEIDGLTASEIARVLTDKFRARITKQAVSPLLNDAGQYVDRRRDGNKVVFRIMAPGEEYLDSQKDGQEKPTRKRRKAKAAKKKTKRKAAAKKSVSRKASMKKSSNKKTGGRSFGSGDAIALVYDEGFLAKPHTIGEIVVHLKDKHVRSFKANELTTPLVRYLRNGKLSRERNADNQYEYKKS